jgi:LacI family xylobiose transport system transcriptional regulator
VSVDENTQPGPARAGKIPGPSRRGPRQGHLTVATIARLAGVSSPTVSRVLNGRPGVSLDTRRRVEELLREHGYRRPSTLAPSPTIEVVFYELESHLAIEIMRGVQEAVREHDLGVGFTDVLTYAPGGRSWADQLLARRPVGVIATFTQFSAEHHATLAVSGIPLVALDPTGPPAHPTPSVGAANWSGSVAATRHLLDLGHRRIGVISGPRDYLCSIERLEACRAALEMAGVPLDPQLVRTGLFTFHDGLSLGLELLRLPDPPTAILCGNDLQALGVCEAARQADVRIPRELSVVGFDNIEAAQWSGPPLTTVRQPLREMGAAAVNLLLPLVAGRTPVPNRVELPTTLVVRGSTAPPAR